MTHTAAPPHGTGSRRRMNGIVLIAAALGIAACGVPTGSDSFERIPDADVPARLADPTTTTTSSTTTTTTTTMPPAIPVPTLATTTSIVPTQLVPVYFISRGRLRAIEIVGPSPVAASELTSLLEAGPQGPSEALLDSYVTEGLIIGTTTQGGIITIDLDPDVFATIRDRNQEEAIAQIVLTFLSNLVGVGSVLFTFDREPLSVPTGNSGFTDEPVSRDDYTSLLVDGDPLADPDATTSTSSSTTTAVATTEPAPATTTAVDDIPPPTTATATGQ